MLEESRVIYIFYSFDVQKSEVKKSRVKSAVERIHYESRPVKHLQDENLVPKCTKKQYFYINLQVD